MKSIWCVPTDLHKYCTHTGGCGTQSQKNKMGQITEEIIGKDYTINKNSEEKLYSGIPNNNEIKNINKSKFRKIRNE